MDNPNVEIIRSSIYFDEKWYRKMYLGNRNVDPAEHYLIAGAVNGFNPSPRFSTYQYLLDNADVAKINMNPLLHYERYGKYENRKVCAVKYEHLPVYLKGQHTKLINTPESLTNERDSVEEVADRLMDCDVISFDIFDTLLLREVSKPSVVFRLVGMETGIPKFEPLRIQAEQEAYQTMNPEKVSLKDIYSILKNYIVMDVDTMLAKEENVEFRVLKQNPYMFALTNELKKRNKRMIVTSDMYLSSTFLTKVLENAGYDCFEKIYVSNEIGKTKGNGTLQTYVQQQLGESVKVGHIGDNYRSDVEASNTIGWKTEYYEQCHARGLQYRKQITNALPLSIYTAICDNVLLNGDKQYSKEYEHGFLYAGILSYGYCKWLDQLAKKKEIDQIWFFGRDMDVVYKIYNKYFGSVNHAYIKTSRSSVMELTFEENTEEFIQYSFKAKAINAKTTILKALEDIGLEFLASHFQEYGFEENQILNQETYQKVRKMMYDFKEEIVAHYEPSVKAAEHYYESKRKDAKRILMVDAGWSGTIFNQLKTFFATHQPQVTLFGALLAGYNQEAVVDNETTGFLSTYLFSGTHGLKNMIDPTCNDGFVKANLFEAMFTSKEPTLLRYRENEQGQEDFLYSSISNHNEELITSLQEGALDFCKRYDEMIKQISCDMEITAQQAFLPYSLVSDDYEYMNAVFGQVRDYKDRMNRLKESNEADFTTMEETLRQFDLI